MTTLNFTCLARVLRNPTPKKATIRLVGIRTSQVRVGVPRPKLCENIVFCNVVFGFFVDKMSTHLTYTAFQLSPWPGCLFLFAETLSMHVSVSDLGSLKVPPWVYPPSPHIFHVSTFMV